MLNLLEIPALLLEIIIAVFFAFKSIQAYDRGNTVRIFVYAIISVSLCFTYVYYASSTDRVDIVMSIVMSAFMFMVAYPIALFRSENGTISTPNVEGAMKQQRLEKLDEPLSQCAPLPYRILRGFAQHFPYRIALVAIGIYVYLWHMDAMTVISTCIFVGYWILALINGIYPFMTKPLRYRLIAAVDRAFERAYRSKK